MFTPNGGCQKEYAQGARGAGNGRMHRTEGRWYLFFREIALEIAWEIGARFRARFRGGDGQTERDACSAEGEGGSASWGTRRHTSAASAASTAASATASAASAAELVYRRTGHNWFMASWERRAPHGPRFHDGSAFTNGIRVTTLKRKPKVDCF